MTWTVRPLVLDDAAEAVALIHAAFSAQALQTDPPSGALGETIGSVSDHITASGGACVHEGGSILGVVLWSPADGALYFGRLAVRPDHHGCGIGRRLLGAVETEARRLGLSRVVAGTRLMLADNRAFFAACGYREVGVTAHPGYATPTSVNLERRL